MCTEALHAYANACTCTRRHMYTHTRSPNTQNYGERAPKPVGMLTPGADLTRAASSAVITCHGRHQHTLTRTRTHARHTLTSTNLTPSVIKSFLSKRNNKGALMLPFCVRVHVCVCVWWINCTALLQHCSAACMKLINVRTSPQRNCGAFFADICGHFF